MPSILLLGSVQCLLGEASKIMELRQGEELVTIDWWEDSGDPHSDQAKVCSDIFYLPGTLPENGTCYLVNSKGTGKQAIS